MEPYSIYSLSSSFLLSFLPLSIFPFFLSLSFLSSFFPQPYVYQIDSYSYVGIVQSFSLLYNIPSCGYSMLFISLLLMGSLGSFYCWAILKRFQQHLPLLKTPSWSALPLAPRKWYCPGFSPPLLMLLPFLSPLEAHPSLLACMLSHSVVYDSVQPSGL